ncbi:MMPL family transporter [Thermoleophilia bacterium SCSIO 60948]|nr:MMPL family transporter [Thermoleophilia bacterium SCSIO 60948]
MKNLFARIAARAVEQPAAVLAGCLLVVIIAAAGALQLRPTAATDELVDSGSDTYAATERYKDAFGEDAVVVLVRGDLQRLLGPDQIVRLLALENCLAGQSQAPDPTSQDAAAPTQPAVCSDLAESGAVRAVYGPASFLDEFTKQANAVIEEQTQAAAQKAQRAAIAAQRVAIENGATKAEAAAAAQAAAEGIQSQLGQKLIGQGLEIAQKYGINPGPPSITDPEFVSAVFFDRAQVEPTPKSRFAYLVPSNDAALISLRLDASLSEDEQQEAIEQIREVTEDPAFQLAGADFIVSGVPVLVDGVNDEISSAVILLGAVAIIVMAIVLALFIGPPLRLLPLVLALGAAGLAMGVLELAGGSLTLASLAVLPILIGLGVDYAIQFQARYREELDDGASPQRAAIGAAARGGPVIGAAVAVTCASFIALLISPIPMIRSFALILVLGTLAAYALSLTAGLAALSMADRNRSRRHLLADTRAEALVDAARRRIRSFSAHFGRRALARAIAAPWKVITVAVALSVAGWALDFTTPVQSDLRELVPNDVPAVQDVDALEAETGVSGEIDVTVSSDRITDPAVINWMSDLQARVLELGGFGVGERCADGETDLCPAPSLPDLVSAGGEAPDQATVDSILSLLPARFSQAMIETDPQSGEIGDTAVLAFGIPVQPLDEQKELIDGIRTEIAANGGPPVGVDAEVVGLPVLAAESSGQLSTTRFLISAIAIVLVGAVLLATLRSPRRALVTIAPIVLAVGWAGLIFWLCRVVLGGLGIVDIALNPMSATLGALVIATATEFSVLLASRYYEVRDAGASVGEALRQCYARTGMPVIASGVTAIAGFATLLATDIPMVRDFGLVTVLDLLASLAGVMLVLPAALVLAERGTARGSERSVLARFGVRRPRGARSGA